MDIEILLALLFQMIIAHAVADFVFQPDAMGYGKNRHNDAQKTKGALFPHWYYWMTSHSMVHAGMVYVLTANIYLGIAELVTHFMIDSFKCEGWFNVHIDQALHIACKVAFIGVIYFGYTDARVLLV